MGPPEREAEGGMDEETFVRLVLRPPRNRYKVLEDFDKKFEGKNYKFESFSVKNERNQFISCTFARPVDYSYDP